MGVDLLSPGAPFPFDELNYADHLFLLEYHEPHANRLNITLREGRISRTPAAIRGGGILKGEGFPIVIDDSCATFFLDWTDYILYQVLNQSFGTMAFSDELYSGKLARRYSASRLLDFVKATTHASDENPGKLLHFSLLCENHIVDVICDKPPNCYRTGAAAILH